MKSKSSHMHKFQLIIKRFAILVLILFSFAIMLLGKADNIIVEKAQIYITDIITPIMELASKPAKAITNFTTNLKELAAIRKENKRLKSENRKLLKWQSAAKKLEKENSLLSELLNFIPPPETDFTTAHIVAEESGAFANSVIAYTGYPNKTKKGQAVVTELGLVGRVNKTGSFSSRILLITDINSKIPVLFEENRTRGILAGDNSSFPQIIFSSNNQNIAIGDRVVTSGLAGAFPPGIPVGKVISIKNNMFKIKPFVQLNKLEYIKIIDYGLKGILDDVEIHCPNQQIEENKTDEEEK